MPQIFATHEQLQPHATLIRVVAGCAAGAALLFLPPPAVRVVLGVELAFVIAMLGLRCVQAVRLVWFVRRGFVDVVPGHDPGEIDAGSSDDPLSPTRDPRRDRPRGRTSAASVDEPIDDHPVTALVGPDAHDWRARRRVHRSPLVL